MLRSEFENRLPESVRKPTDKEYEVIELVYNYHPLFACGTGRERIARLYSEYGMRIIYDMQETAKRIQEIRGRQKELQKELSELVRELSELEEGVW